jgi:NADH:ubiquinone oxidoreductase subunit 6 (subunit J)
MLNLKRVELYNPMKYIFFNVIFFIVSFYLIITYGNIKYGIYINFNSCYSNYYINWYDILNAISDIEVLSLVLYSYYAIHFLLCGFILLLTIISVIFLTKRMKSKSEVRQVNFKQLTKNYLC